LSFNNLKKYYMIIRKFMFLFPAFKDSLHFICIHVVSIPCYLKFK